MKFLFYLSLLVAIVRSYSLPRDLQISASAPVWRSCIEGGVNKWCRGIFTKSVGECCAMTDTAGTWIGEESFICSNNNNVDPNVALALWPEDTVNCGEYEMNFTSVGNINGRQRNGVAIDTVWVYKITSFSSEINAAKIKLRKFLKFLIPFYSYFQLFFWG